MGGVSGVTRRLYGQRADVARDVRGGWRLVVGVAGVCGVAAGSLVFLDLFGGGFAPSAFAQITERSPAFEHSSEPIKSSTTSLIGGLCVYGLRDTTPPTISSYTVYRERSSKVVVSEKDVTDRENTYCRLPNKNVGFVVKILVYPSGTKGQLDLPIDGDFISLAKYRFIEKPDLYTCGGTPPDPGLAYAVFNHFYASTTAIQSGQPFVYAANGSSAFAICVPLYATPGITGNWRNDSNGDKFSITLTGRTLTGASTFTARYISSTSCSNVNGDVTDFDIVEQPDGLYALENLPYLINPDGTCEPDRAAEGPGTIQVVDANHIRDCSAQFGCTEATRIS